MSPRRSADTPAAVILILLGVCVCVFSEGKVYRKAVGERAVKLTCSSTCSFRICYYSWSRNGALLGCSSRSSVWIDSTSSSDQDTFRCWVYDLRYDYYRDLRCELVQQWGVAYTPERVCALEGSSVDLSCSYKHPEALGVTRSVWFINRKPDGEPVDLREEGQYEGRVQFGHAPCRLTITGLRASDAQTYKVRFYTDDPDDKYTGEPGVRLSVTGLKVRVSNTEGGGTTLTCSSTCSLSYSTFTWFRNGQPVSECRSASCPVAVVSGEVSYSCAAEGHDLRSPPVYSPKDTRAEVLPSGERVEGGSVTLTCSSDADPPVLSFSWFKQSPAADEELGSGQNYSITNISSQHSGLVYCTALSQLGQQRSAPARLDLLFHTDNPVVKYAAPGVAVVVVLLIVAVGLGIRRRRAALSRSRRGEKSGEQASPVYDNISALVVTSGPIGAAPSDDQSEVQYSTVQFRRSHTQEVLLSSEEEEVQYATVSKSRPGADRSAETLIYSTVQKTT